LEIDEYYAFNYAAPPARFAYLSSTAITTDAETNKINYISPAFGGFQLAGSYMLASADGGGDGPDPAGFENGYAASLIYRRDGFGLSAAFAEFRDSGAPGEFRRREFSVGSRYYWRGFQVAASYRHVGEDDNPGAFSNAGYAVNYGIAYEFGPIRLSLTDNYSSTEGDAANPRRDRANLTILSGKYALSEDVSAALSVGRAAYHGSGGGVQVGTMSAVGLIAEF
jgi:predicted porin